MPVKNQKKSQMFAFMAILLVMLVIVAWMFKPLANVLLFSAVLSIVFRPLYNKIHVRIKSSGVAAGLTVFIVLFALALFFWIFGQLLWNELSGLYDRFRGGEFILNRDDILAQIPSSLREPVRTVTADLNSVLSKITAGAFQTFSALISNVATFFFNLFIIFFAFFFLLRDGAKLKRLIQAVSPISDIQENVLLEKIVRAVNGVIKGTFLVAVVQTIIATIGFFIVGLPSPFLWTMCVFLAAFIPNVGTAIVNIPAILFLLITHHPGAAIIMTCFAIGSGLIDNFIGPRLVGRSAKLHPLLVLLSVIGGLQFFGFVGFLIGPIITATFVALLDTYLNDFKEYLER